MRARAVLGVGLCALGILAQPADPQPPGPLELGLEERVGVRLVLVDFLVLDGKGRTIPDLTRDDFELLVNGNEVAIASLDRDCPVGKADDPVAGARDEPIAPAPTLQPRQIVIVFDYFHMTGVAETFDRALGMLDRYATGDERHMVVSLGQAVRIEVPFTSDLDEVRRAFRRMRDDPELYAGNYGRLTEHRFFERIRMLFDLLEPFPGRKNLVLLSGPLLDDHFFHDPAHKELSALSTLARTALYPVDTGGLRLRDDPLSQPLGGPDELRRLANETGGRMTADTNDIGVAYGRAHRDLGCTYTLGFNERPRLDRERRLTIRVRHRSGLRLVYPEFYVVRSRHEKRRSLLRTAAMVPSMFASEGLDAELFVIAPASTERWRTLFAVEIRSSPGREPQAGETRQLKGLVRKPNGTVVHSFDLEVPRPPQGSDAVGPLAVTVFHEMSLRPGHYLASAVLVEPGVVSPRSVNRAVELVPIPRGAPFLVSPVLGHRADDPEFEPLVNPRVMQGESLDARTLVCVANAESPVEQTIVRQVTAVEGRGTLHFDPFPVQLPVERGVRCRERIDLVSTSDLEPGRYAFRAFTGAGEATTGKGSVEFTVEPR